jgi:hypothetical protein
MTRIAITTRSLPLVEFLNLLSSHVVGIVEGDRSSAISLLTQYHSGTRPIFIYVLCEIPLLLHTHSVSFVSIISLLLHTQFPLSVSFHYCSTVIYYFPINIIPPYSILIFTTQQRYLIFAIDGPVQLKNTYAHTHTHTHTQNNSLFQFPCLNILSIFFGKSGHKLSLNVTPKCLSSSLSATSELSLINDHYFIYFFYRRVKIGLSVERRKKP